MGTASAALVYDTSLFGGTSPVLGRRYRLEFGSNAGGLSYSTALADYREYVRLPRNLTLAGRVLHFGRYGGGAEDQRLQELYLGYPALIRGYSAESFSSQECGPELELTGACPSFDQLLGSRVAVANAELRIPIIGALGLVPSRGFPPVEFAPFFDAGVAWRKNERLPVFQEGDRSVVKSYGASLRTNVLGFAVFQFSYVRPMDRAKGWHFEFSLPPVSSTVSTPSPGAPSTLRRPPWFS
jgi:outer membrane protein assembly factor BamA